MARSRFARWLAGPLALLLVCPALLVAVGCAGPESRIIPNSEPAPPELAKVADEVAKEVEALRGWQFKKPVASRTCTAEAARAFLDREITRQIPDEQIAQVQAMLRTVGLLPEDCDLRKAYLDVLQGQIDAFYDSDSKALYIVKRNGASPGALIERSMLAHELTHALDDQEVDLEKFTKANGGQTEDMDLVTASVFEGSATALMMQYMARAMLSGKFDQDELKKYTEDESGRNEAFLKAPRYFSTMLGAYICGTQFLAKGNLFALVLFPDNKAIGQNFLAAVKDPPQSSEQILHPEKYWDPAKKDPPVLINDGDVEKWLARKGRFAVHADTLGEMLCAIVTTPKDAPRNEMMMVMASSWTTPAATGWGGDRFFLLSSGSGARDAGKTLKEVKGVWLTLWDTPKARDQFVQAYEQKCPIAGRTTFRFGNQGAIFFFGFDEAERKALEAAIEKSPPRTTHGGKPWSAWAP